MSSAYNIVKPIKYCNVTPKYKFDATFLTGNNNITHIECMELYYPFKWFIPNAQGWGEFKLNEYANVGYYYTLWRELIGEIGLRAHQAGDLVAITAELIPKKAVPNLNTMNMNMDNMVVRTAVNFIKDIKTYDSIVQHSNNNKEKPEFVGIRLRLTVSFREPADETQPRLAYHYNSLGAHIEKIIRDNAEFKAKRGKYQHSSLKQKNQLPFITSLTKLEWQKMCAILTGHIYNWQDTNANCADIQNVFNPIQAFSVARVITALWSDGAAVECCDPDNYEDYCFPFNNEYVYRISVHSFQPTDQAYCFFPHIKPPMTIEQKMYLDSFGGLLSSGC